MNPFSHFPILRTWLLITLCTGLVSVHGARTESWVDEGFLSFAEGEAHNVSLHLSGLLETAPALALLQEIPEPILWAAAISPDGKVAMGTGNRGVVLQWDPESGEVERVFSSGEVMVRALAYDAEGRLYVGTAPRGQVYRIGEGGRPELYFLPKESYIWDLRFDGEGYLYVAVGSPAKIYRVAPDAKLNDPHQVWFSARQEHVTVLEWDAEDRLLAGTSPSGILYRIKGEGEAESLFQAEAEEIKAIVLEESGTILFSTYSSAPQRTRSPRSGEVQPVVVRSPREEDGNEREGGNDNDRQGQERRSTPQGRSEVFRLGAGDLVEWVWQPDSGGVLSLLPLGDGTFLAGSEEKGKLYRVRRFDDWEILQQSERGGGIALLLEHPAKSGALVLTTGPSRIYHLHGKPSTEFRFSSRTQDLRRSGRWGRIHLVTAHGADAIAVETRTGNTEQPDTTWSPWQPTTREGEAHRTHSPPARFLQYRIIPREESAENPPRVALRRVRGFHHAPNLAPRITHLRVFPVGFQLQRSEPGQPSVDLEQLVRMSEPERFFESPQVRRQLRPITDSGQLTVLWRVVDPDDDEMRHRLYLKKVGDSDWKLLADNLEETIHSFNTRGFPNGYYHVRVVSTDLPDNDPELAQEGSRVSEVFLIDNASPELELLEKSITDRKATVRLRASDPHSVLRKASYQLNGAPPIALRPDEGIFDDRQAEFTLHLDNLRGGDNSLLIEVTDERGNSAVLGLTLRVTE